MYELVAVRPLGMFLILGISPTTLRMAVPTLAMPTASTFESATEPVVWHIEGADHVTGEPSWWRRAATWDRHRHGGGDG